MLIGFTKKRERMFNLTGTLNVVWKPKKLIELFFTFVQLL